MIKLRGSRSPCLFPITRSWFRGSNGFITDRVAVSAAVTNFQHVTFSYRSALRFCSYQPNRTSGNDRFFVTHNSHDVSPPQLANILRNLESKASTLSTVPHQTLHAAHINFLLSFTNNAADLRKRLVALVPLVNVGDEKQTQTLLSSIFGIIDPDELDMLVTNRNPLVETVWGKNNEHLVNAVVQKVAKLSGQSQIEAKRRLLHLLLRHYVTTIEPKNVKGILQLMTNAGIEQVETDIVDPLCRLIGLNRQKVQEGNPYTFLRHLNNSDSGENREPATSFSARQREAVMEGDIEKLQELLKGVPIAPNARRLAPLAKECLLKEADQQDAQVSPEERRRNKERVAAMAAWLLTHRSREEIEQAANHYVVTLLPKDPLLAYLVYKEVQERDPHVKFPARTPRSLFSRLEKEHHYDEAIAMVGLQGGALNAEEVEGLLIDLIARKQSKSVVKLLQMLVDRDADGQVSVGQTLSPQAWEDAIAIVKNDDQGGLGKPEKVDLLKKLFVIAEAQPNSVNITRLIWNTLHDLIGRSITKECERETLAVMDAYITNDEAAKAIEFKELIQAKADEGFVLSPGRYQQLFSFIARSHNKVLGTKLLREMMQLGINPPSEHRKFVVHLTYIPRTTTPTQSSTTTTTTTTTTPLEEPTNKQRRESDRVPQVESLVQSGQVSEAVQLAQAVLEEEGAAVPFRVLNKLLIQCAAKERIDLLRAVLPLFPKAGCHPSSQGYNETLRLLGKHGLFDEVLRLLDDMEATGVKPIQHTYVMLTSGVLAYFHSFRPQVRLGAGVDDTLAKGRDLVRQIIQKMDRSGLSFAQSPMVWDYLASLMAYAGALASDIEELFELMRNKHSTEPSLVCYNNLIKAFTRDQQWQKVTDTYHQLMKQGGVSRPNGATYLLLFNAIRRRGEVSEMVPLFEEMLTEGKVMPTDTIMDVILKACRANSAKGDGSNSIEIVRKVVSLARPHLRITDKMATDVLGVCVVAGCTTSQLWEYLREFKDEEVGPEVLRLLFDCATKAKDKPRVDEVVSMMKQKGMQPPLR